ncbi:hypothetical protein BZA77DRAFT_372705 [Pyronema omphalodes]|nr:hypothetical protein BZA77DRAFT_372705 [Pyronema omphalodes]
MSSIVNNFDIGNDFIIEDPSMIENAFVIDEAYINGSENFNQHAVKDNIVALNVSHMGSLYSLVATAAVHPYLPASFVLQKNGPIHQQGMKMVSSESTDEPDAGQYYIPAGVMNNELDPPSIANTVRKAKHAHHYDDDEYFAPSIVNVRMAFKVTRPNADLPYGKSEIRIFPGNGRSHLIVVDDHVLEPLNLQTMHEPLKQRLARRMQDARAGRPTQSKRIFTRKVHTMDSRSKKITKRGGRA